MGLIFPVLDTKAIADDSLVGLQADVPYIAGSVVGRIEDKFKWFASGRLILKLKNQRYSKPVTAEQGKIEMAVLPAWAKGERNSDRGLNLR